MDIYKILAGATITKTTKRIGTVESASIYQKLLMSNGTVHTTNGILGRNHQNFNLPLSQTHPQI